MGACGPLCRIPARPGPRRGAAASGFAGAGAVRAAGRFAIGAALAGLALAFMAASGALAGGLPPLSENRHVVESLRAAVVADAIRRECPSIHGRIFLALRKARQLERYARSLGYSKAEIDAFIRSPEEKARIIALARAYAAEKGVVEGDKETYCRLGREEIAKGTLTGQLLWSW